MWKELNSLGSLTGSYRHHFSRNIHQTYAVVPELRRIWSDVIPMLACDSDYLTKAMLSVGALHLTVTTENDYLETARRHITDSMMLARPHIAEVSEELSRILIGIVTTA